MQPERLNKGRCRLSQASALERSHPRWMTTARTPEKMPPNVWNVCCRPDSALQWRSTAYVTGTNQFTDPELLRARGLHDLAIRAACPTVWPGLAVGLLSGRTIASAALPVDDAGARSAMCCAGGHRSVVIAVYEPRKHEKHEKHDRTRCHC